MRFGREFLQELLSRTDLLSLVSEQVRLRAVGRDFVARCPFHEEKTASFTVSPQKGFFHCFGCQAHGNAIDFFMRRQGCSFPEAVKQLAEWAGLPLPQGERDPLDLGWEQRDFWFRRAVEHYEGVLASEVGSQARGYLVNRGFSEAIWRRFRVGFAPLLSSLSQIATPEARVQWQDLGLLVSARSGDSKEVWDRFRGRIVFPIQDPRKGWVGFGGRALGDRRPKYLNSPETAGFQKGQVLYRLPNRLGARLGPSVQGAILVEGYLDVLAIEQLGLPFVAVASLGTAVGENQLSQLFREFERVYFGFDSDEAGKRASYQALGRALPLLKEGRELKRIQWPDGKDPAALVESGDLATIRQCIEEASSLSDWIFGEFREQFELTTPEGRAKFSKPARSWIEQIPDEELQAQLLQTLATYVGRVPRSRVSTASVGSSQSPAKPLRAPVGTGGHRAVRSRAVLLPLALILQSPELAVELGWKAEKEHELPVKLKDLFHSLLQQAVNEPSAPLSVRLEAWRGTSHHELLMEAAVWDHCIAPDQQLQVLRECLQHWNFLGYKARVQALMIEARRRELTSQERKTCLDYLAKLQAQHAQGRPPAPVVET